MSFSRYDPRSRYRHRSQQRMTTVISFLLVAAIGSGVGYGVGYQSARMDQNGVKSELEAVTLERDQLRQTVTRLMADSHSANIKYQQIEEHLQSELPQEGPLKDIVSRIRDQLTAGRDPERIAEVIRSMSPPKNCSDPETKRFIVQTPKNKSADSTVVLAEGAITIRATGESAKAKNGQHMESWFDPSQPVKLTFEWKSDKGTETLERRNNLPISQVLATGGKEYRMTFAEGARSFIKVTFDRCDAH